MANHWRTPNSDLVFTHEYEGYQFPGYKDKDLKRINLGLTFGEKPGFDI